MFEWNDGYDDESVEDWDADFPMPREVFDRELDEVREVASMPREARSTDQSTWVQRALTNSLPPAAFGARAHLAKGERS